MVQLLIVVLVGFFVALALMKGVMFLSGETIDGFALLVLLLVSAQLLQVASLTAGIFIGFIGCGLSFYEGANEAVQLAYDALLFIVACALILYPCLFPICFPLAWWEWKKGNDRRALILTFAPITLIVTALCLLTVAFWAMRLSGLLTLNREIECDRSERVIHDDERYSRSLVQKGISGGAC